MSGTKQLGIVLIIFGALLLIGAAFAYTYAQSHSLIVAGLVVPLASTYPYRDDSVGLIIGGVALFVVGFALMVYRNQNSPPPPPPKT